MAVAAPPGERIGEMLLREGKADSTFGDEADVELAGEEIGSVKITGDFFLEPAEALDGIAASLKGALASASEVELARRVAERLPEGVEMIGFGPEAIATAVKRAIDDPTPRERL